MSPPGRHRPEADGLRQAADSPRGLSASGLSPKGEYRSTQHEGTPVTAQARGPRVGRIAVAMAGALLLAVALWQAQASLRDAPAPTHLALIVPDDLADDDVHVQAWQDAAVETGFAMEVVRASQLLQPGGRHRDAALIVPDSVHRRMNDALVARLEDRVRDGALLMLVHDAGVHGIDGRFHPQRSRLSALAGVDYALYDRLGAATVPERVVYVDAPALRWLQLPPGKLLHQDAERPLVGGQSMAKAGESLAVAGYHYGRLRYSVFATHGRFDGQRLMHADGDTLVAGLRRHGAGRVLFVNLPLGELKLRTDGLLLHGFLRLFAQDVAQLPQLSPMPQARGALIMNWHIDSSAAAPAMQTLERLGVFDHGPFSVHLTAGPDLDAVGDKLGMDLPHNPVMRAWVRRFAERGDEIGSHGGWIHNAFGTQVGRQEHSVSAALIERNVAAVAEAAGRPVREYSAPLGNHPAWVTPWLREHGIRAYYTTGDIGMAPTRSYQDGARGPADMWSFPVLSYGAQAAFEEASAAGVSEADIAAWLDGVSDFCAEQRTVRLVYFHPPGLALYPGAFKEWLVHTGELVRAGALRWTTMARQADFANDRLLVRWQLLEDGGSALRLQASHPRSLDSFGWLLPAARYGRPEVSSGQARVDLDGAYWRVVAGPSTALGVRLPLRSGAATTAAAAASSSEPLP